MLSGAVLEDSIKLDVQCTRVHNHTLARKDNRSENNVFLSFFFLHAITSALVFRRTAGNRSAGSAHSAREQHQRRRDQGGRRPVRRVPHQVKPAVPQAPVDSQCKWRILPPAAEQL